MIALYNSEEAAEAAQKRVFGNGKSIRADRFSEQSL
jgi:hypothetical protein